MEESAATVFSRFHILLFLLFTRVRLKINKREMQIPHTSISAIFLINFASISAILFFQSRFHFSSSCSSIPLPFQRYNFHQYSFYFSNILSSIPLPFLHYFFIN